MKTKAGSAADSALVEAYIRRFPPAKYKVGKGSVQFPLAEKLPLALIGKIVRFRVKENLEKIKKKKKK